MPNKITYDNSLNDPGWDELFIEAGRKYNVDPMLLKAMMYVESGAATDPVGRIMSASKKGAIGPMQLMPSSFPGVDPYDPAEAIPTAAKYLAQGLKQYKDPTKALMFYNGGPDQAKWDKTYPIKVEHYYQMLQPPPPQDAPTWANQPSQPFVSNTAGGDTADLNRSQETALDQFKQQIR